MKRLLIPTLLAFSILNAITLYVTVTPDSHLVFFNYARDTIWKSNDVVPFDSATIAALSWDSKLLQGKDTTALWDAKTLRGRDTTDFDNAKTLRGKDTNSIHVYVGRDSAKVQKGDTGLYTRVGIGKSPAVALDVVGALNVNSSTGGAGTAYGLEFATSSSLPRVDFVNNGVYVGQFSSNATDVIFKNNRFTSSCGLDFRTAITGGNDSSRMYINNLGLAMFRVGVAVCSTATRSTEKLFVKGNVLSSGHLRVDSTVKGGSFIVGDTVMVRTTGGAAFAATTRFETYADSCAGVDSINLALLNASGARARVITLRDSVFVKNGATVITTLTAAGKWCDLEYLGAPCSRWQVFGSN